MSMASTSEFGFHLLYTIINVHIIIIIIIIIIILNLYWTYTLKR